MPTNSHRIERFLTTTLLIGISCFTHRSCNATEPSPTQLSRFLEHRCLDCHGGEDSEGGLDLSLLMKELAEHRGFSADHMERWVAVHDRVRAGEMPPAGAIDRDSAFAEERDGFVGHLFEQLVELDREIVANEGRTVWRRMNRFEYENSLRDLLQAPWLQLATILPEDGELHRFNKSGEALDVSHVNMARYMQAADYALRQVLERHDSLGAAKIQRFYAREQESFNRRVHYNPFNRSPERATFPLIGYQADLAVLRDPDQPFTVGESDPELREQESFGVVASSYEPIEIRFSGFEAPEAGRYKLRFKGYTFWAAGEDKRWWRPDREKISRGRRSEPVTIYSQLPPRQLRRLGEFDFQVEPSVQELDVWLLEGETIQPDAVRLFRSRPSNWHNPLAEEDGMPGVAFAWLEVEGPEVTEWPSAGHRLLFADLPLISSGNRVSVSSADERGDAKKLMSRFLDAAYARPAHQYSDDEEDSEAAPFLNVVWQSLDAGQGFTDSMLAGYTAVLCSPRFLCTQESPGRIADPALAVRLSRFLWNSSPDAQLQHIANEGQLQEVEILRAEARRMLQDEKLSRFVNAFLDYWLDLRKINDTSPDELLYPDYYLDDALVDAALEETRLFFAEMVRANLPIRNLVDSDFTFANERLARHYELPPFEGGALRRVALPTDSVRGGLLTQASVLKVTANGTTTSPVVRGAWVNERILGIEIPPPPASVPAIEPDTRGATTIRQQLELHRSDETCNHCHAKIDPAGFALECFDVAGGYRDYYRILRDEGEAVPGFGKNGQPFQFKVGPSVDASGILPGGEKFNGIRQIKQLLLNDQRQLARNLLSQLVVFATGAAPRFSDRVELEAILDRCEAGGYPVGTLVVEVASSQLFLSK
ncbi:MAG: DUF1592 domain-containing protein [Planctomycetales bacterium]|nr:DUF1592 domain-containing protein [Planctomycetales bacterium]